MYVRNTFTIPMDNLQDDYKDNQRNKEIGRYIPSYFINVERMDYYVTDLG